MKSPYLFAGGLLLTLTAAFAQTAPRVGVGTTTPRAGLEVSHDDGFVATGTLNQGNTDNLPTDGGTRLMWIPRKAAFRAGRVLGNAWDAPSVGLHSVALGFNTAAGGEGSVAMGSATTASGLQSLAVGTSTVASGNLSTAMGYNASTNGKAGSFVVGDAVLNVGVLNSGTEHEFSARFSGGYRLFSNAVMSQGLFLSDAALVTTGLGPALTGALPDANVPPGLPTGAGTRLLWLAKKGAFRAGTAATDEWDYGNVGTFSVAFGSNNRVTGLNASAFGGDNTASGNHAVAMGQFATASASYAHASGLRATASGPFSRAEGTRVSTNQKTGSYVLGDASTFGVGNQELLSSADHEYSARFAGGYRWTTDATTTQGMALTPARRLSVGTLAPRAGLDVSHDDGLLVTGQGPTDAGAVGGGNEADLPTGEGTRLLWLSKKAAFRAGRASGGGWDYASVGVFSTALGNGTTAGGKAAVALGEGSTASADFALAMGKSNTASALGAVAMGRANTASAETSIALGGGNTASGLSAVALGKDNLATAEGTIALGRRSSASGTGAMAVGEASDARGIGAIAMGYQAFANGAGAVAMGTLVIASGVNSTALGHDVSTNGKTGSFIVGDNADGGGVGNDADRQFMAVFSGGYKLRTSRTIAVGVSLGAGGNAWSTISDSTKKAGFRPADGASFLRKIAAMRLGSWHYKGQDAATMRHYGPMAQDFFAAFGQDGVGTVGCDTLINGADFDGVNLIAIQALVEKTDRLEAENRALRTRLDAERHRAQAETTDLRRLLSQLSAEVQNLKTTAPATAAAR